MQADKQLDLLTEEDFVIAQQRQYRQSLSRDDLQQITRLLVDQPVWQQTLSCQELKEGGFGCWREYVAWSLIKAW